MIKKISLIGMTVALSLVVIYYMFLSSCQENKFNYAKRNPMLEQTFAMIKPDAVAAGNTGKILDMIENNGFKIIRLIKVQLTPDITETFYAVHKDKPFFGELVEFITSGPVVLMALEKENAIADWRKLMGATNPAEAEEGTIRKLYAESIGKNAVHGSDSQETAQQELSLFFANIK